jgi:hypothetical protein
MIECRKLPPVVFTTIHSFINTGLVNNLFPFLLV